MSHAKATLHFLDSPHPAALPEDGLMAQCDVVRGRARGPGGQHRNKVETAVSLTHRPTGIIGQASERRQQQANRRVALFRLRVNLALAARTPRKVSAPPSALWRSRVHQGQIRVNPRHEDFPTLLAEVLDVVYQADVDLKRASILLDCTLSQLVKFLKLEPRALAAVNQARQEKGQAPYR